MFTESLELPRHDFVPPLCGGLQGRDVVFECRDGFRDGLYPRYRWVCQLGSPLARAAHIAGLAAQCPLPVHVPVSPDRAIAFEPIPPLVTEAFVHQIAEAEQQTSLSDEADIFLAPHPDFVNSPANGTKMVTALTMMGKRNTATSLDMEQAYETLRDNNAL